jgi:hypothetical protein
MTYSDAFESLYTLSLDMGLPTETKYKRVAMFLRRIRMAELIKSERGMLWTDNFKNEYKKELALCHVLNLTDVEWGKIKGAMMKYATASAGTDKWRSKRIEWVRALDTLRAFS